MNNQQKNALLAAQILLYPLLTDDELLARLNTKDIPIHIDVETRKFELYLMSHGLWVAFKSSGNDAVVIARDALYSFSPVIDIDQNYLFFVAMIQGLVDDVDFTFTVAHQTDVLAMADSFKSWVDQNLPDLTVGDIMRARV